MGPLIALVQAPVGTLIDEIDGTQIVSADVPIKTELLILLHSRYPDPAPQEQIMRSLSRRSAGSVSNALRDLHNGKLIHGSAKDGYRLLTTGYNRAVEAISTL